MRVGFEVKVKNGALMQAAEKMGGMVPLAKHLDVNYPTLIAWGNFRLYPTYRSARTKYDWKSIEKKLFDLTGLLLEDIFPEELATSEFLAVPKKRSLVKEVELCQLSAARHLALPPSQEIDMEASVLTEKINDVLATLTPREEKVIKRRFGIGDNYEHSLAELGEEMKLTQERVRQIEAKALRKLRHPFRANPIMRALGWEIPEIERPRSLDLDETIDVTELPELPDMPSVYEGLGARKIYRQVKTPEATALRGQWDAYQDFCDNRAMVFMASFTTTMQYVLRADLLVGNWLGITKPVSLKGNGWEATGTYMARGLFWRLAKWNLRTLVKIVNEYNRALGDLVIPLYQLNR